MSPVATAVRTIVLPELTPWQRRAADEARRFNVLACGRRSGKTTLGLDRLIHPALRGLPVAWCGPTYGTLADVWRDAKDILADVIVHTSEQEKRLELVSGGSIKMWSLDEPDSIRGRAYARIVVDEAAMVPNLEGIWTKVLRPELTDYKGDAWFLSTPKGLNYFHTLYQLGQRNAQNPAAENPEWSAWRFPTSENPLIDPAEIEDARRQLPERTFAQEYLAEFLEDGGAVFRNVHRAATAVRQEKAMDETQPPLYRRHSYAFGIDWARSLDFSVVMILDLDLKALVYMGRWNQVDYALQMARVKILADAFQPIVILSESNGPGDPVNDQLRKINTPWGPEKRLPVRDVFMTQTIKQQMIEGLSAAFDTGQIRILNDETLIGELLSYASERLPSGKLRYSAPEGMHDDCVMAAAIAWSAMRRQRPKMRVTPQGTSVFRV
jgi:phage FluMu gp28-like protein